MLNRIQVDIEVDSNLKGLKKGNASVNSRTVCGLHGSRQRKKKRKKGTECLLLNVTALICIQLTYHVLLKFGLEMGLEISESAAKFYS